MAHFHKLKVKDIKRETPDAVSIAFDIPTEVANEFTYTQGQYVTIKQTINGEEVRRSYSACSSPVTDNELRIAVKRVDGGKMSTYLNNGITVGQELEVMKPMGNFFTELRNDGTPEHHVAFAAGSGITPILSLLKTMLAKNESNTFTLIYGNRDAEHTIFKAELDALEASTNGRLKVYHIHSRAAMADEFFAGRISPEKCTKLLASHPEFDKADAYFLCGPFDMIMSTKDTLIDHGVAKEKIHFELFTTPEDDAVEAPSAEPQGRVESQVTIVLDGDEMEITVSPDENILDAVLDAGMDAPYACTGGSCCTCRAKIMEGSAEMDVNYALTDEEVEQGYILTCQSHPTSSKMIVDFDEP